MIEDPPKAAQAFDAGSGGGPVHWYKVAVKKYAVLSGRARRREYWFYVLVSTGICLTLTCLEMIIPMVGIFAFFYALASVIPGFTVTVRRLHDTGRSGWWMLLCFIPLFGIITLLVFLAWDSQHGNNKYGPNPKAMPTAPSAPAYAPIG